MLDKLNRDELLDLIYYYDKYIQYANETNAYKDEWYPVCVNEFLDNDLEIWKEIPGYLSWESSMTNITHQIA